MARFSTTNLTAFIAGAANFVAIVVVNDTLRSEEFQAELSRVPDDALFFVGDECHHHASTPLSISIVRVQSASN